MGVLLWLKADAIVGLNDADPVTTWEDSSAANNDATQATEANKPTYQTNELNSLPVVRFDTTDLLSLATALSPTTCTVAIVFRPTSTITSATATAYLMFRLSGADPAFYLCLGIYGSPFTGETFSFAASNAGSKGVADNENISGANLFICTLTGTTDKIWKNGTDRTTLVASGGHMNSATSHRLINVDTLCASFVGDIAELRVDDAVWSDAERNIFGGYIQSKYGITVAGATFTGIRKKLVSAYMRAQ